MVSSAHLDLVTVKNLTNQDAVKPYVPGLGCGSAACGAILRAVGHRMPPLLLSMGGQ